MGPPITSGEIPVFNSLGDELRRPQRSTFLDAIWPERDIGLWVSFGRILNLPLQRM